MELVHLKVARDVLAEQHLEVLSQPHGGHCFRKMCLYNTLGEMAQCTHLWPQLEAKAGATANC